MNKDLSTEKGFKIGDTWDDVKNKYPSLVNKDIHLDFANGLKFEFNKCGILEKIWICPKNGTPASNNIIIG